MRNVLIAAALSALAAAPSAAQTRAERTRADQVRGAHEVIERTAPAIDRATGAMLDLDVGPLLDAADPYGRRGRHRTLRDIAGRDDPRFERRLRASIYGTAAGLSRTIDAFAAAEPALRRSVRDMEDAIAGAVDASLGPPPRRLPPGDVDDNWDLDLDDEATDDEPY
ncbi:MAG TPA: hypothetical protein VMS43_15755 [Allosphingosinicella sp.]|nr:hypothetical protein [Allosphingosinicella sp.]